MRAWNSTPYSSCQYREFLGKNCNPYFFKLTNFSDTFSFSKDCVKLQTREKKNSNFKVFLKFQNFRNKELSEVLSEMREITGLIESCIKDYENSEKLWLIQVLGFYLQILDLNI